MSVIQLATKDGGIKAGGTETRLTNIMSVTPMAIICDGARVTGEGHRRRNVKVSIRCSMSHFNTRRKEGLGVLCAEVPRRSRVVSILGTWG